MQKFLVNCDAWEVSKTQSDYKASMLHLGLSNGDEGGGIPKDHTFCSNQNLFQSQEESNSFLRNTNNQGILSYLLLLVLLPCVVNHFC